MIKKIKEADIDQIEKGWFYDFDTIHSIKKTIYDRTGKIIDEEDIEDVIIELKARQYML